MRSTTKIGLATAVFVGASLTVGQLAEGGAASPVPTRVPADLELESSVANCMRARGVVVTELPDGGLSFSREGLVESEGRNLVTGCVNSARRDVIARRGTPAGGQ